MPTIKDNAYSHFNPEGSPLRQHQLRMLGMLEQLDAICRRHRIPYWLSSGTLIGAVRHGGFIPWDDDVDIEMMEDDYRKLLDVLAEELHDEDFAVQTTATDPEFLFPFAKFRDMHSYLEESNGLDSLFRFRGCYIDIFVISPSSSKMIHRLGCKLLGTEIKLRVRHPRLKCVNTMLRTLLHKAVFPAMRIASRIGSGRCLRHKIPSFFSASRDYSDIFPLSEVSFEGRKFPAPGNADAYLRKIYGDYMRLPDPDKIQVHTTHVDLDL
ncbi:MAG: LicD family protein [Muribaculum sp.]|nr:LicD family protein [Muribaculum sp.]